MRAGIFCRPFFGSFLREKGSAERCFAGRGIGAGRASPLRGSPPFSGAKASRHQHPFPLRLQPPKPPGANTPSRHGPSRHGPSRQRLLAPTPLPAKASRQPKSLPASASLPAKALDRVLSFICAVDPCQKCCEAPWVCRTLTGRVTMICVEAPQARITRLACYGARLRGARQRLSSPRPLPRPIHCLSQFCQSPARLTLLRRASEAPWVRR